MPAYTSFISDVYKSYRVEKIVLHHLIFYLSRLVSVYWFQTQFYHNCKYKASILGLQSISRDVAHNARHPRRLDPTMELIKYSFVLYLQHGRHDVKCKPSIWQKHVE